jgi:rSAM/selenodomain-associated transferase 2
MATTAAISLIIPVLNEADLIEQNLRRASSSGVSEVIVVDGGSTDGTVRQVLGFVKASEGANTRIKFLNCGPGRGKQINLGLAEATGDVLLILHADNWLAPDFARQIQQLQEKLQRSSSVNPVRFWGGFRQRIQHPGWRFRWLELGNQWRSELLGLVYGDQAMYISRSLIESVGSFQPIPLMEDYEISSRLRKVCRPRLLPGPVYVSPRRWLANGVLRQTLRNASLVVRYQLGVSPEKLAGIYRRRSS